MKRLALLTLAIAAVISTHASRVQATEVGTSRNFGLGFPPTIWLAGFTTESAEDTEGTEAEEDRIQNPKPLPFRALCALCSLRWKSILLSPRKLRFSGPEPA